MTTHALEKAGIKIDPQDIFGHCFYDAVILLITAPEETMTPLFHITRHGGEELLLLHTANKAMRQLPVPSQIYFHTDESWYMCKTADFFWKYTDTGVSASFLLYKIKAQYMASAGLAEYSVLWNGITDDQKQVFLLQRNSH